MDSKKIKKSSINAFTRKTLGASLASTSKLTKDIATAIEELPVQSPSEKSLLRTLISHTGKKKQEMNICQTCGTMYPKNFWYHHTFSTVHKSALCERLLDADPINGAVILSSKDTRILDVLFAPVEDWMKTKENKVEYISNFLNYYKKGNLNRIEQALDTGVKI